MCQVEAVFGDDGELSATYERFRVPRIVLVLCSSVRPIRKEDRKRAGIRGHCSTHPRPQRLLVASSQKHNHFPRKPNSLNDS